MRLVDLEKEIKSMMLEDSSNPEIYSKLVTLIYRFVKWKGYKYTEEESYEVAIMLAEDMFIRMKTTGVIFYAPLEYIRLLQPSTIMKVRKGNFKEIFDVTNDPKFRESLVQYSCSGAISYSEDYTKVADNQFLSNLGEVINELLKRSKYRTNSSVSLNLSTSIILSLLNDSNNEIYFRIDESEREYIKILLQGLKMIIKDHIDDKESSVSIDELFYETNSLFLPEGLS